MEYRAARLLAVSAVLAGVAHTVSASSVQLSACQCLLAPGDRATVSLSLEHGVPGPAALLVALRSPNGQWSFLSPAGMLARPDWTLLAPQSSLPRFNVLDEVLTPESLPFANPPVVGPFRYLWVAALYDLQTFDLLSPIAWTYFDFLPRPPAPYPDDRGTLFLIPHHHNDIAWLHPEATYLDWGAEFLLSAVREAESDDAFRFTVDQVPVLRAFAARHPELAPALGRLVDEGRCDLGGGFFVEPDLNLLSGESLVRQAILGQRYLQSHWGRRSRVAWNVDAFGHPLQMPQIAKKAGMDFYALGRGRARSTGPARADFHWESPDGSRVLAAFMPFSYQIGAEVGQTPETDQVLSELFRRLRPESASDAVLVPVGADAHLRVFAPSLSEASAHWNGMTSSGATSVVATPTHYFEAVEASGAELELVRNAEFQSAPGGGRVFAGAYAARMDVKQANNRLENLLLDVERLATLASFEGFPYPEGDLRQASEWLAVNQTHDYLAGTGVDEIYEDGDEEVDDLGDRNAALGRVLDARLDDVRAFFASRIGTSATLPEATASVVVFNTMAWPRRELVTVAADDLALDLPSRLVDGSGREVPYQRITLESGTDAFVFVAAAPAMGYTTYRLVAGTPGISPDEEIVFSPSGRTLPLGRYVVTMDERAHVQELVSTASGRRYLSRRAEGLAGGQLRWRDEIYGNAYEFDEVSTAGGVESVRDVFLLRGPVMERFVSIGAVGASSLVVRETRLVPELETIDFTTTLYWADVNKNLYVEFPMSDPGATITEGVPYGFAERGEGHFPALHWADYGDDAGGVTLLNRGLFDHAYTRRSDGSDLQVTLLRSLDRAVFGEYPSQAMKQWGIHRFRYALVPRDGSWRSRAVPRLGWQFNSPLVAFVAPVQSGTLPPERSYLALSPQSDAVVSVLQREGEDVVARLYETSGRAGTHRLDFPRFSPASIAEVNLLGDGLGSLGGGSSVTLELPPQGITTLRLAAP